MGTRIIVIGSTIGIKRTTDNMIINRVKIFNKHRIIVVNNQKEVVINIIDLITKSPTSKKRHDNFNMILRENIWMDVHNMNRVKAVDHSLLTAIFVGKMDIMQINVRLKPKEKHLSLLW